jgi:cation transport ATPase
MSELTVAGAPDQELKLREAGSEGAERLERRLVVALFGGMLLLVSWISKLLGVYEQVHQIPAALGAAILVVPLMMGAWHEVKRGRPSSDTLACLAVTAAFASQNYLAAGFLAFFLWTANLVLSRTAWGAQRAIRDLIDLTPEVARILEGNSEREVGLAQVKIGQIVRVRPGENLPVDGRIIRGHSDINQASLTGEAVPIEASVGTEVYAGTTNLTGQIDVEVTAIAGDTTIGKVESLIREAESAKDTAAGIDRGAGELLLLGRADGGGPGMVLHDQEQRSACARCGRRPRDHRAGGDLSRRALDRTPDRDGGGVRGRGPLGNHDQADQDP